MLDLTQVINRNVGIVFFSSDHPKIIYYYINIENINSNEKNHNYELFYVFKVKNNGIFVICYFSLTFGCVFLYRPDPEVK